MSNERCAAALPSSPSSAISRTSTEWTATLSPTATATSTTPSSPPPATTSAASSGGSGFYCASSWPCSSLRQIPWRPEKAILHRRLYHSPLPPFQFLCSTWNPVSSPRPTHVLRPTRTGPVKVGRRSALAARSVVSRPRLDRPEHGGHAGYSRDDDQRGALPSGADHRATTLYSVGP